MPQGADMPKGADMAHLTLPMEVRNIGYIEQFSGDSKISQGGERGGGT